MKLKSKLKSDLKNIPVSGTYLPLMVPIAGQNIPTLTSNKTNAANINN